MSIIKSLKNTFQQMKKVNSDFARQFSDILSNTEIQFNPSLFFEELISYNLPEQYYTSHEFGEFNVTLFNESNLTLQIYFMDSIITNIHDHPFEGAFKVLKGESVHSKYSFSKEDKIVEDLHSGKLTLINSDQICAGDVVSIEKNSIHQIFRLAPKNITLLASHSYKSTNSQYFYPGLRLNNFETNRNSKKLQALEYTSKLDEDSIPLLIKFTESLNLKQLFELYITYQSSSHLTMKMKALDIIENEIKKQNLRVYQLILEHNRFQLNLQKKFKLLKF